MSFGSSNPPWQRNIIANAGQQAAPIPNIQSQILNPNLVNFQNFNQNLSIAQHQSAASQNNLTIIPSLGSLNTSPLFNQPLQYPNTRSNLNQNTFSGSANPQQQQQQQSHHRHHTHQQHQQQPQQLQQQQLPAHSTSNITPQMCNKIGVITKMQSNYGFVDDEVFFHKSICKGFSPKIGDRVLVEATYCTSSFKWNAKNIQLVQNPNSRNPSASQQRNISNSISPNIYSSNIQIRHSRNSPGSKRSPDRNGRTAATTSGNSKSKEDDDIEENRKRRERERARDREKERQREKQDQSSERRDRSPYRKLSPKRKVRAIPRYLIQMPKVSLVM